MGWESPDDEEDIPRQAQTTWKSPPRDADSDHEQDNEISAYYSREFIERTSRDYSSVDYSTNPEYATRPNLNEAEALSLPPELLKRAEEESMREDNFNPLLDLASKHLAPSALGDLLSNKGEVVPNQFRGGTTQKTQFQKQQEQIAEKKKKEEESLDEELRKFQKAFANPSDRRSRMWIEGETVHNSRVVSQGSKKFYKIEKEREPRSSSSSRRNERKGSDKPPLLSNPPKKKFIDELKEEFKQHQQQNSLASAAPPLFPLKKSVGLAPPVPIPSGRMAPASPADSTTVFVVHLPSTITPHRVWELFGKFGGIEDVKFHKNFEDILARKEEGKVAVATPEGATFATNSEKSGPIFAEIEFSEHKSASSARRDMDNFEIFGKRLRVVWEIEEVAQLLHHQLVAQQNSTREGILAQTGGDLKISLPSDVEVWKIIDRCAMSVWKHGMEFEFALREKTKNDPRFRFLTDPASNDHYYYRWKIYSLIQGDRMEVWRTLPFQMILNGPVWVPPEIPLVDPRKKEEKVELSSGHKQKFQRILEEITVERSKIRDGLAFAFDNRENFQEIVEMITNSFFLRKRNSGPLSQVDPASPPFQLARAYLISDILWNSQLRMSHASSYRSSFESKIPLIVEKLRDTWLQIEGRMSSNNFKEAVLKLLRIWESWALYPPSFFQGLISLFTTGAALEKTKQEELEKRQEAALTQGPEGPMLPDSDSDSEDIDGTPLEESELLTLDLPLLPPTQIERLCRSHGIPVQKFDSHPVLLSKLSSLKEALRM